MLAFNGQTHLHTALAKQLPSRQHLPHTYIYYVCTSRCCSLRPLVAVTVSYKHGRVATPAYSIRWNVCYGHKHMLGYTHRLVGSFYPVVAHPSCQQLLAGHEAVVIHEVPPLSITHSLHVRQQMWGMYILLQPLYGDQWAWCTITAEVTL